MSFPHKQTVKHSTGTPPQMPTLAAMLLQNAEELARPQEPRKVSTYPQRASKTRQARGIEARKRIRSRVYAALPGDVVSLTDIRRFIGVSDRLVRATMHEMAAEGLVAHDKARNKWVRV